MGFLKVSAQEVSLTTYGVSPYNVTQDSIEHYFDRRYYGLLNVGIETKVFLEGSSDCNFSQSSMDLTFGTSVVPQQHWELLRIWILLIR